MALLAQEGASKLAAAPANPRNQMRLLQMMCLELWLDRTDDGGRDQEPKMQETSMAVWGFQRAVVWVHCD